MGPSGRFTHIVNILDCLRQVNAGFIQVLYLGRAPRIKETLPNFLKWRRVVRHPLVFRGLTGSQRTPGFGASQLGSQMRQNFQKKKNEIFKNEIFVDQNVLNV